MAGGLRYSPAMGSVYVAASVAAGLALLLGAAVVGKVHDRDGWRILAVQAAGSGRRSRLLLIVLPLAEGAVAVALLATPQLGLVAATALFATLALGVHRLRPRLDGAPCACFGAIAPGAIGRALVRRNAMLAAFALVALPFAPLLGPPAPVELAAGALGAALLLTASRLSRLRPRLPLHAGARLRLRSRPAGEPAVIVLLAPGCPPCERLAAQLPALAAVSAVPILVGVRPGPDAAAMTAALGSLHQPGLWQRLTRFRQLPGTPFAIALDADGVVRSAKPADEESILGATGALTTPIAPGERLSRGTAVRTAAVAFGALAVLPLAAGTASAKRRKRRPKAAAWDFKHDPRNHVDGDCGKFHSRIGRGVYDAAGHRLSDTLGYTYAEGFETGNGCSPPPEADRLPTSASIDTKRVMRTWRGHCPCPTRMQNYTDESKCHVDCPSGLACFGYQCVTDFEEYCVEVLYTIKATRAPKITITALEWAPPANSSPRCKVYAQSYNDFIRRHEEQHAQDTLDVIKEWENKNDRKYLKRCAPTEAEAMAQVLAAMEQERQNAYADLMKMDCARNAAFHGSGKGRSATPNCDVCK